MKAEDTVIKNEDIMELNIPCGTCEDKPDWGFPTVKCMECMALKHREAQAEISFKAGQGSRCDWHKPLPQIISESFGEGKKAGIKEVAELVVFTHTFGEMPVKDFIWLSKEGKAKLKEWGL